jgi:CheY-like chemotaxis protein/anti-sigma regulatory factor (Ser/Thr protein kinase)
VALLSLKADEKGVRLRSDIDPSADGYFEGDAVRVRQIATNLVSNALKFTDKGEVLVEAAWVDGALRLSVADTGCGFDAAVKEKIFGRFQQADSSITRRFGGSGLGLAISRHLVSLMGGEIDCESTPGEGSVFWVELPLAPASGEIRAKDEFAPVPLPTRALRVLAADDHPINIRIIELILAQVGAELTCVNNGRDAIEAFEPGRFDIILMDMQMPVLDGLSAVAEIRGLERKALKPRTPILMLTANALPEHREAALQAGADGHVSKPVSADSLIRAIVDATDTPVVETDATAA